MKKLLILLAFVAATAVASAFSFSVEVPSGQTIYLTVTGDAAVKVVSPAALSWSGYTRPSGRLDIPATVSHEGTVYSVTAIDHFAFQQCYGLTAVSIPGSVVYVGQRAFAEDTMLTSVVLAEGVQRVDQMAFHMCSSLDTIVLPTSLVRIGVSAFESTAYYFNPDNWIDNVMLTLGGWLLRGSPSIVGDVAVPEGTVGLANNAFYFCQTIAKAQLPASLLHVGEGAFKECYALDTVEVAALLPPTLGDDSFEGAPQTMTVVVPCGAGDAYSAHSGWSRYAIVEASCGGDEPWVPVNPMPQPLPNPLPQLAIGDLPPFVSVAVVGDGLQVCHAEGLELEVYDMMGRRLMSVRAAASVQQLPLPAAGLYVLRFPSVGASVKVSYCK